VRVVLVAAHRDGRRAKHCNSQNDDQECPRRSEAIRRLVEGLKVKSK
jgi:hypothetical protein